MRSRPLAARALLVVSSLAALLMVLVAVNVILVFVLFTTDQRIGHAPSDLGTYLPWMAIGSLPFAVTAALVVWAIAGDRAGNKTRQTADALLVINLCGLPFMVLLGFWAGFFAAAQMYPTGSPAADALYVWQYFYVAAIVADVFTIIVALMARRIPPS